jgi:hypothetical protein
MWCKYKKIVGREGHIVGKAAEWLHLYPMLADDPSAKGYPPGYESSLPVTWLSSDFFRPAILASWLSAIGACRGLDTNWPHSAGALPVH